MSFRQQHSVYTRSPKRRIGVLLLTVFAALIFSVNYFTDGAIAMAVRASATSILGTQGVLGEYAHELTTIMQTQQALMNERDALLARVEELELYAINNTALVYENRELRALFAGLSDTTPRGELATILSRAGDMPYGTMLISRDVAASYDIGARVYSSGRVAIGTVTEIGDNHAVITLFSAPGQETPVILGLEENTDTVASLLEGRGNGNMVAVIPREIIVQKYSPVILQDGEMAVVGFVGSIEQESVSAFQTLRIRTPVNLHTLRFVEVR